MSSIPKSGESNKPLLVARDIWAFPENEESKGTISWWVGCRDESLLIDCPAVNDANISFLKDHASGKPASILLTSREGHGRVGALVRSLGWPVLVQEQEAYLLPGIERLKTFQEEYVTRAGVRLLWTPGPTPGSCVAYVPAPWNVLFCGRLLVHVAVGRLAGLRTRKTFHWPRQLQSLKKLRNWIPRDSSPLLASSAPLGGLADRGVMAWEAWTDPFQADGELFF